MKRGLVMRGGIGAYVADRNSAWAWVLGAEGYLINAILIARLMHERPRRHAAPHLCEMAALIGRRVVEGLRRGFGLRTLMLLTLANGIFFAAWAPYWLEWPQFFNETYGVGVWVAGWLYALFPIARVIGAEVRIQTAGGKGGRANRLFPLPLALGALLCAGGGGA